MARRRGLSKNVARSASEELQEWYEFCNPKRVKCPGCGIDVQILPDEPVDGMVQCFCDAWVPVGAREAIDAARGAIEAARRAAGE